MNHPNSDTLNFDPEELCQRIAALTRSMMDFWEDGGWAPGEAALLLDKSMLHWQSSLAESLTRWMNATSEGDLILAWANLGALIEGQLKLFLCVYYHDYTNDLEGIRRRGKRIDPDGSQLEELRQFFVKRIWDVGTNWNPYVQLVQQRRNAVHAFQHRELGTHTEWMDALRLHLSFIRDLNGSLPYPDEISFCGCETKGRHAGSSHNHDGHPGRYPGSHPGCGEVSKKDFSLQPAQPQLKISTDNRRENNL
ncbi:MAG: hypothetical protein JJU29_04140 [Verrucomicrobia bacterium]|nr:hypothetical protein [Verrucomicrobiota bacterium]MCH8511745.1 hypothetical protein [Kiritimatiellia bacterium]